MKVDEAKLTEERAAGSGTAESVSTVDSRGTHDQTVISPASTLSSLTSSSVFERRVFLYFVVVTILLLIAIIAGIAIGSTTVAPGAVVRVLLARLLPAGWVETSAISEPQQIVVWAIRTPRVLVAALTGAALAMAGAQMQGLFKNPLASPDIIGTSSGGALGAVLALVTGLAMRSLFYLPVFSFIGAFVALFAVYIISSRQGRTPIATLLLTGVALNALVGAATSFLITMSWVRFEIAQEILFWLLGGLDNRSWSHFWIALPCIVIGAGLSLVYTRELDLMLTGEETAQSLGVDVEHVKRVVLTCAALLTGTAVAVSGVVGFVGLIVPHIVRLVIGPSHRRLIPASALTGAAFLVFADLLARTLRRPEEIRLGIITAAFGAPFFLYLLLRHRREVGYL